MVPPCSSGVLEQGRYFGLDGRASSARAPLRKTAVSGSAEKWRRTIRRLTPPCRHQLSVLARSAIASCRAQGRHVGSAPISCIFVRVTARPIALRSRGYRGTPQTTPPSNSYQADGKASLQNL